MNRIIVTGANGVGKSHFAARLALARPDVPLISFDAIKLQTNWKQRPRAEIESSLATAIDQEAWILEGGPSLRPHSIENADALVWLDPYEFVRVWNLFIRPWKNLGKSRTELPPGNVDWPLQQYSFALRSLRKHAQFRAKVSEVFRCAYDLPKWRCRNEDDRSEVLGQWRKTSV